MHVYEMNSSLSKPVITLCHYSHFHLLWLFGLLVGPQFLNNHLSSILYLERTLRENKCIHDNN